MWGPNLSRGIHTKPNVGQTVHWLTPPFIIAALGPFDLDPCGCAEMPWRTATSMYCPPTDGLAKPWHGAVWLNPPYGENHLWMRRLAEHGSGIALVASRTEVDKWFVPYVWNAATSVLFLFGRLHYHYPDGTKAAGNAGHGSVLVAYGQECSERLETCGLRGQFIHLEGA